MKKNQYVYESRKRLRAELRADSCVLKRPANSRQRKEEQRREVVDLFQLGRLNLVGKRQSGCNTSEHWSRRTPRANTDMTPAQVLGLFKLAAEPVPPAPSGSPNGAGAFSERLAARLHADEAGRDHAEAASTCSTGASRREETATSPLESDSGRCRPAASHSETAAWTATPAS
jgi:hypothetical protein